MNMRKKDWRLLKAYQDTGLTPEQVVATQCELARRTNQVYKQAEELERLRSEVVQIHRERDAAVLDLKQKASCDYCANAHDNCPVNWGCECGCDRTGGCPCYSCEHGSNWQWRGAKEDSDG